MLHAKPYRGRLAPSPTGYLHLGHARTFWVAQERARARGGELILRNEDLDAVRFKMEFVGAMLEDMRWFGLTWSEGPDVGGKFAPYNQSERMGYYRGALEKLRAAQFIYPCTCSRKDIREAVTAPHEGDEAIYPGTCHHFFLTFSGSRWRGDFISGRQFWGAAVRCWEGFWGFCGVAGGRDAFLSIGVRSG